MWGDYQPVINKTGILSYQDDSPEENQLYFEEMADPYYAYSRIGIEEIIKSDYLYQELRDTA